MQRYKGKPFMNTLLNIENVFGEYEGHWVQYILTILIGSIPLFIWLFFLIETPVPFWLVVIITILWTVRWGLIFIGHEKQKMEFYNQQRHDEYESAKSLIHLTFVHPDGLLEYDNGSVAYLVTCFPKGYLNDDVLSKDLEDFMNELDKWNWDLYLHNVVDEVMCSENLPNLKRYSDPDVIRERVSFYNYQDEWARSNTGLYRITFLVRARKNMWKKMRAHLEELTTSDLSLNFVDMKICNHDEAYDIMDRDICNYVDINKMLAERYDNDNYYGSKVLWYDDDIPEELMPVDEYTDQGLNRDIENEYYDSKEKEKEPTNENNEELSDEEYEDDFADRRNA